MSEEAVDLQAESAVQLRVDPQTQRIDEYRERIDQRRRDILELTLQEEQVRREIKSFEHEYNARVGRLYLELDRTQLEIKELMYKARLLERGWIKDN
ncbi:MAG: hypothetical protein O3A46_07795, partial [Candidatus Poribacteria bacterium]|nr:hypothetical protein [Candidatus Poribacteria bacterium]